METDRLQRLAIMAPENVRSRGAARLAAVLLAAAAAAAAAFLFLTRTGGTPARERREPVVSVAAAEARREAVPIELQAVGAVEAYAVVAVKSRIEGQLVAVHFREGQEVRQGDLLFTIDPRPHRVALQEAEARLKRDEALYAKAETDARRYAELVEKNYVSRDKYEQFRANAEALRATVEADRAVVERARLNLEYCFIRAPFSGRTGRLLVDRGSQVKANDDRGGLVEIAQVDPIYVGFALPQQHLAAVKERMAAGAPAVKAFFPDGPPEPEAGTLAFLDNKVNSQTGTFMLKGVFENARRRLWPGQFVTAVLTLATRPDAVVVPAAALQAGQEGQFVFVVGPEMIVESRPVSVGMRLGEKVVIEKGVAAGEKVVTEGQLKLVPGSRVQLKGAPPA
jgi:multidrug efflux system membrane fusion protein